MKKTYKFFSPTSNKFAAQLLIKRRTRVATLFPNTASCLRLVTAILAEQDEEWMTAKIYLTMKP